MFFGQATDIIMPNRSLIPLQYLHKIATHIKTTLECAQAVTKSRGYYYPVQICSYYCIYKEGVLSSNTFSIQCLTYYTSLYNSGQFLVAPFCSYSLPIPHFLVLSCKILISDTNVSKAHVLVLVALQRCLFVAFSNFSNVSHSKQYVLLYWTL